MKALFIASRPIYPIICGGQIRTEQQLEFLSKLYEVDVVFLTDQKEPPIEQYFKFAKQVRFFYRSKLKSIFGTLRFLINKLPLQVNYFLDKKMKRYIRKVAPEYDLIFCNNIRTTEYALCLNNKRIVDFVDAISMNYDKARKHTSGIRRLIYDIDYHRCNDYEKKLVVEFDACSTISVIDKNYILSCQK